MSSIKRERKYLFNLKQQLFLVMSVLFAGISVITLISYRQYVGLQTATVKNTLQLYSSQLALSTNEMYETCQNISYSLAYDTLIQSYICDTSPEDKYINYRNTYEQLTNVMALSPYILDISILGSNGNSISVTSSAESYRDYYDALENTRFSFQSIGCGTIGGYQCQIAAMPVYKLSSGTSRYLGILFLALDTDKFFSKSNQILGDISITPEIVLMDHTSSLIYGDRALYDVLRQSRSPETQLDIVAKDTSYIVSRYDTDIGDCSLYVFVNQDTYLSISRNIGRMQLLSLVTILLLTALIILGMYQPLISSLHKLTGFMKDISEQKNRNYKTGFTLKQGVGGCVEIEEITNAFNEMLIETNKLNHTIFHNYTKMYELEINSRKTEIAFLRSQVNPHFLYNTLTMICGMASAGMQEEIIDTASALSAMFRYSIKGTDMVPLREELEIVQSYLKIQTMRFENRFSLRYELAEDSLSCLIPKMVIQPLVENAIVHGLEPNPRKGELLIGSGHNPKKGYLAIWIFDTGIGMPPEKLQSLRASILHEPMHKNKNVLDTYEDMDNKHHDSIGILNVNSRMVLYFGNDYSLIIDSEEGVGTNVQLRIPYHTTNGDSVKDR